MKKLLISSITIAAFVFYAQLYHKTAQTLATVSATKNTSSQLSPASTTSLITTTPTPQPGKFRDGEYTGDTIDAYYGFIQVKATIKNGKLADVTFLQYPDNHHESIEINTEAMPILKQEAIQSQSANVDIVSRATDSSKAFSESLASALSQAE